MKTLTILNSIAILFLFFKLRKQIIKINIDKNETFYGKKLTSYNVYINGKYIFKIPIKNEKKAQLKEEINYMINSSQSNKRQQLAATFSWLKTIEQVRQFEKDYSVVDKNFVKELVADFGKKVK